MTLGFGTAALLLGLTVNDASAASRSRTMLLQGPAESTIVSRSRSAPVRWRMPNRPASTEPVAPAEAAPPVPQTALEDLKEQEAGVGELDMDGAARGKYGPDGFTLWASQMSRFEPLSSAEEQQLGGWVQEGAAARSRLEQLGSAGETERAELQPLIERADRAQERLVLTNQSRVKIEARKFARPGYPIEDMFQFGIEGLMEAARRYKPEPGAKFWTYAKHWVRKTMWDGVNGKGSRTIHVPREVRDDSRALDTAREEMKAALGRSATDEEVRARLTWGRPRFQAAHEADGVLKATFIEPVSSSDDDDRPGVDLASDEPDPEAVAARAQLKRVVRDVLAEMDRAGEREARFARLLRLRFGLGNADELELRQIAEHIGATHRTTAFHVEKDAIAEFRRRYLRRVQGESDLASGD